ncbi:hypothetical protein [Streptomyces lanatus]|uniref:DUF4232 domain-containing protein n=1 Tax=Streptomyces lanatus TaxID=66900 RepID=A0ABV1Y0S9_9ACTN|nr:hypothetical protein [Streptomyces lanatus]
MNHGPDDQGPAGLDSDELALRRLLHDTVQEMEPRDGTLDHLRRAVPARRARKRQALVGMAAAALFVGTAVPALVHVSNSTGTDVNSSVAGHGEQAQGGSGPGKETNGGQSTSGGTSGKTENQGKGNDKEKDKDKGPGGSGQDSGDPADPSATTAAGVAACTAEQLGTSGGSADAPDTVGAVYGTFRFSNISTADCTVGGPGTVSYVTGGAADATKITSARHVSGDAAAALPDPSQELTSLLLKPGASYEVRFAWVPSETCPTTGDPTTGGGTGGGEPSPDPTPTDTTTGATEGTSTGGDTGTSTQLMAEDTTAEGSVTVTNTTEAGAPTATVTVSNACAGTVYWTGVLAGA